MSDAAEDESEVEHVSIMEYNNNAEKQGREPGERVIVGGHRRNTHVRDDEIEGFVEVAEAVAIIELHQPIAEDEVTDWCNSQAGKLALAPFVGDYDPEEVIDTGSAAKERAMTDGGRDTVEAGLTHFVDYNGDRFRFADFGDAMRFRRRWDAEALGTEVA